MKIQSNLKRLFVSRTRQKLIQILFYSPNNFFYVRQLVRLTGEEINSVRRELANLKLAGVVLAESRANKLYYSANFDSPFFPQLLIVANQTIGLGQAVYERLDKLSGLRILLYSYQFAINQASQPNHIDLIVVGELAPKEIEGLIKDEEQRRGREINYMLMPRSEYKLRCQKRDPFIVDFFLDHPLLIVGSPKDLVS